MKSSERAFQRLMNLEGEWHGSSSDGAKELRLLYVVASKKSVVIEFYKHYFKNEEMEDEMVTVYHPDGDKLMLTHYCTLGNQPRMVAELEDEDADVLRFSYVGATNLSHADCLRMSGVAFKFYGNDSFEQTWKWCGKKAHIAQEHRSDDHDDIADDGPGEDMFRMYRLKGATGIATVGPVFAPVHSGS
jgi:hypothetical protein